MYRLSIPVMVTSEHFDREQIARDLKAAGAGRVFLAISALPDKKEEQDEVFSKLEDAIRYFKKTGIEVGVWYWAFMVKNPEAFTPVTVFRNGASDEEKCPMDEDFLAFSAGCLQRIARMKPDLIMFDDDLRFGFTVHSGFGCVCPLHRKRMGEILGEEVPAEGLFEKLFSGKPNQYRSAFLRANGESIENFARRMRAAVDEVDPGIRLGQCACLGTFDPDGTDPFTVSRLLAGKTKPFLRLIGAPYWAERQSWGNRLQDVIELERMERAFETADDIEIFSEGDAFPRPRYHVPASYLELFDSALRASGGFDGILKYMFDYTSSPAYERGYLNKHLDGLELRENIRSVFDGKDAVGIRVYESMKVMEDADFTGYPGDVKSPQMNFFSFASRMLACNTLPTTFEGTGCAGIVFGENARHLPPEALEKPLILDLTAAEILCERGIDTGLRSAGDVRLTPTCEYYLDEDEKTSLFRPVPCVRKTVWRPGAQIHSEWKTAETDGRIPACVTYENARGQRFVIFTFDGLFAAEDVWRNYCRPRQTVRLLAAYGVELPAVCFGNPDLYSICKSDGNETAIGLWNCFADSADGLTVVLNRNYRSAEFFGCDGKLNGGELKIRQIPAFGYGYILLK